MCGSKTDHSAQNISFKLNRADAAFKDPLLSRPLESGGANGLFGRISYHLQLSGGDGLSKRAEVQRHASIEILVRLRPLGGRRTQSARSRNQVQAAGLI